MEGPETEKPKTFSEILEKRVKIDDGNTTPNRATVYVDGLPYTFIRSLQKGTKGKIILTESSGVLPRFLFQNAFEKARDGMLHAAHDAKNVSANRRRLKDF